ncbi:MAG: hypothetical protein KA354_24145 [Phycisphaerae bacterium]|nr:hypothetical protein [Phycisphaerae bacterium]
MSDQHLTVSELRARFNYRAAIEKMGFQLPEPDAHGQMWIKCPIHTWKQKAKRGQVIDERRCSFDPRSGMLWCRACGYRAGLQKFMVDYLGISGIQAFELLCKYSGLDWTY